jgi:uncharacterized protein YkwD
MAFERLRAHGAAVGTIAVIIVAGVSVVSLVVAEGRLEQVDHNGRADGASTVPVVASPPSIDPAPSTMSTTTTTTAVPGPPSGLVAEPFALMNADRAARGVPPLTWDDRLGAAAQDASDAMAESGLVAQQDLDALLALGFARAAANVLTGPYDVTATSAEYGWMGSAPHRATILDAGLRSVGIGATSSPDGRIWMAVDFGGAA